MKKSLLILLCFGLIHVFTGCQAKIRQLEKALVDIQSEMSYEAVITDQNIISESRTVKINDIYHDALQMNDISVRDLEGTRKIYLFNDVLYMFPAYEMIENVHVSRLLIAYDIRNLEIVQTVDFKDMPYHRSTVDVFSDGDFLILAHYDQKAFYLFDSKTPDLAVTFHMDAYEDSQEVIVNHGMIHLIDRMSDHEIIYDYTNQTYLVASSSNQFQYLYDFKADDTTYRLYSENMDDLYLEIDGVRESVNYLDIIKKSDAGREILSVLDYKRNVVNEATVSCFYRDFMYYLRFQVRSNTTYSPSMLFAYDVMNDEVKYVTYDDDQVVGVYFTT